jgi:hypothetical protein
MCISEQWGAMFNGTPYGGRTMVAKAQQLIPLEHETRTALPTTEAAGHLNRAEQTLRLWACHENGPLRPIRVNGRLAWPVAELRRILHADPHHQQAASTGEGSRPQQIEAKGAR